MTGAARPQPRSLRLPALLLLFLALLPAGVSLARMRQLFTLGGLTDNWIYLGANLRVTGVLGEDTLPMVLRAPGYPLFLAGIFAAALEKPPAVSDDYMLRGAVVVYAAQALLLALSGLVLFLWLASFVTRTTAFAAGLLLATNPYARRPRRARSLLGPAPVPDRGRGMGARTGSCRLTRRAPVEVSRRDSSGGARRSYGRRR